MLQKICDSLITKDIIVVFVANLFFILFIILYVNIGVDSFSELEQYLFFMFNNIYFYIPKITLILLISAFIISISKILYSLFIVHINKFYTSKYNSLQKKYISYEKAQELSTKRYEMRYILNTINKIVIFSSLIMCYSLFSFYFKVYFIFYITIFIYLTTYLFLFIYITRDFMLSSIYSKMNVVVSHGILKDIFKNENEKL